MFFIMIKEISLYNNDEIRKNRDLAKKWLKNNICHAKYINLDKRIFMYIINSSPDFLYKGIAKMLNLIIFNK